MKKRKIENIEQIVDILYSIVHNHFDEIKDYTNNIHDYTMFDVDDTIEVIKRFNELEVFELKKYIELFNYINNFDDENILIRFNTTIGITRLFYYYPEIVHNWKKDKLFLMGAIYNCTPNKNVYLSEKLIVDKSLYKGLEEKGDPIMTYGNLVYEKEKLEYSNYVKKKIYS